MNKAKVDIDYKNTVISVRGLKKAFEDFAVLRGIDLDLYQGENLVVLGRSGTGKSVLIKLISGLLKPDAGSIEVLGQDVTSLNDRQLEALRIRIGFSFQNSALYDSMTVRKNLEFPLVRNRKGISQKDIDIAVETVLDAVGLSQTINQMPSELSGGQRKRIGIARTLILNPEIMLYDEPTAGLDPITCIEINDLINEVQQRYKTSSIIITHDLTCAKSTGDIYTDAVKDISMILLIIAGSGAFKQVLTDSGITNNITNLLQSLNVQPLFLGWLIAAIIRISLGSATVAGLTAAGIVSAMVLHDPTINPNLMVLAIGAGSLAFSHVNDGGFWLFKEYFNLSIKDTIRSWSVMETIVSVVGLVGVLVLNVII